MLQKRTFVSPPEAPISWADGKLPPIFHVNVVTAVLDDGKLVGKQLCHRVAYCARHDGTWARGVYRQDLPTNDFVPTVEPDDEIEAALAEAEPRILNVWAAMAKNHGIMDHAFPDATVVTHERAKDGTFARVVKG